ncbi:hypothetical protein [Mesorhizobium sp. WSM3626]|uniref:hypothetical protein n=1 Tax=Mesorhizobium sp. WSM3626 TaxID=1040987 RepID=UPI00051864D6|nr:hypothetical protein [Mesorhizobium sp. WSM3626]
MRRAFPKANGATGRAFVTASECRQVSVTENTTAAVTAESRSRFRQLGFSYFFISYSPFVGYAEKTGFTANVNRAGTAL